MIKIYFGADSGYTSYKVDEALKKNLSKEEYQEIIRFDGYKDLTQLVVEDCSSISLFGDKKIVLFSNCYFLANSSNRKAPFSDAQQKNYKDLLSYFESPSPDTDLYMVVDASLKKSGPLYEAIKEGSDIFLEECALPSDDDYLSYAFKLAKAENKVIDTDAAKIVLERSRNVVGGSSSYGVKGVDYLTFKNTMNKLLTYTSHVTKKDVEELVYRPLEDNVFEIINSLMEHKTSRAIEIYHDIRKGGLEPLAILPAFASKFRDYALLKYLLESSNDNADVAAQLSKIQGRAIKPGAIYYRRKEVEKISFDAILKILSDLAYIEQDIKLYQDNADIRLEVFLSLFYDRYILSRR